MAYDFIEFLEIIDRISLQLGVIGFFFNVDVYIFFFFFYLRLLLLLLLLFKK